MSYKYNNTSLTDFCLKQTSFHRKPVSFLFKHQVFQKKREQETMLAPTSVSSSPARYSGTSRPWLFSPITKCLGFTVGQRFHHDSHRPLETFHDYF